MATSSKPHAFVVPYPGLSHIKAHIKLAKLLYSRGFQITLVNTEYAHRRFLGSRSDTQCPGFQFVTIPDGLPRHENPDEKIDFPSVVKSNNEYLIAPFVELLKKKIDGEGLNRRMSCIVSDGFLPFTIDAAREIGIANVKFFSVSASIVLSEKQFADLNKKGLIPPKDENMDTVIDWNPGLKDFRFKDLPMYARRDPNDLIFKYIVDSIESAVKASAIVFETFDALEKVIIEAFRAIHPNVYAISPLQLLLNHAPLEKNPLVSNCLWKEDNECLQWLDKQRPNSVIYINFGSIATMEAGEFEEFAMGLVNSNHPFLWIMRPDFVEDEQKAGLPSDLSRKIEQGKGFLTSWCDQEKVLNHESIGGFLTHGGWNSLIECISAGVPMLCCPCHGDQPTGCWLVRGELGMAIEIRKGMRREDVEKAVNELMEGEKGKKMKAKAMEWKRMAHEAAAPDGSSSLNLDKLIKQLVSSKN